MMVDGSGIASPIEVAVVNDFSPSTKLAISWKRLADRNWFGIDRTSAEDVYESSIRVYGSESSVNAIVDAVEDNRTDDTHYLYFYDLNSGERFFGADVDYTQTVDGYSQAYKVTAIMDRRIQGSLHGFGVSLKIRNLSPDFNGSPSLPTLNPEVGYTGDAEYTINKYDTYDGTYTYIDRDADSGIFEGVFRLSQSEMSNLRQYVATQRTASISITGLGGVDYPFGRRSGSYPYSVKVLALDDMGLANSAGTEWKCRLTLAEVI